MRLIQELADYEKAPQEVTVSEAQMSDAFSNGKLFEYFVAETEEQQVVGIALFYYKYSTWKGRCIYLEDIVVTQTHRRQGIGKALFEKVVERAKSDKVKRLQWQVLKWNTPAIDFYKQYKTIVDDEWYNCKIIEFE